MVGREPIHSVDVVVVGGGPVGLAAAIGARLCGCDVIVVEPRGAPVDKACGEGLMPGAVAALEKLGVQPHGHPIAGITYLSAAHPSWRSAQHDFRSGAGVGMRRTALSAVLTERAVSCGVQFRQAKVESLVQDAWGVTIALAGGSSIRCRWLLGCDGLHSTVRALIGLEPGGSGSGNGGGDPGDGNGGAGLGRRQHGAAARAQRRYGLRQHFVVEPWSDHVEVYWSPHFELYVTPVDERMIGVAVLGHHGLDLASAIAATPALAARLTGVSIDSSVRGAGPLRQRVTKHAEGRVLLVGDASGYVDALTGEGLRVGFGQAAAAVAALSAWAEESPLEPELSASAASPSRRTGAKVTSVVSAATAATVAERYERGWVRASRGPNRFTAGLLAASRTPLRHAFVPVGAHIPALFSTAVEHLSGP
ncbi:MAG: NAD(P)/FAD-dependent oxidoreductase [Subtercola sp.]|nr:NAD(P)/FAD-dependent oxidoreductase [Subtercola sp.]